MEYLKKTKLYELTKELLNDKEIPLMKDCEYKSYKGAEWLYFLGIDSDYHSYKISSQVAGSWISIEEFDCGGNLLRSEIYAERKNGEYTYHSVWEHETVKKNKVKEDIIASGFKPTESLIKNILRLSEIEGNYYSLKELATLYRKKIDFSYDPEKAECFNNIIKECQEQELERMQKPIHFTKQEMMLDLIQTPGA